MTQPSLATTPCVQGGEADLRARFPIGTPPKNDTGEVMRLPPACTCSPTWPRAFGLPDGASEAGAKGCGQARCRGRAGRWQPPLCRGGRELVSHPARSKTSSSLPKNVLAQFCNHPEQVPQEKAAQAAAASPLSPAASPRRGAPALQSSSGGLSAPEVPGPSSPSQLQQRPVLGQAARRPRDGRGTVPQRPLGTTSRDAPPS